MLQGHTFEGNFNLFDFRSHDKFEMLDENLVDSEAGGTCAVTMKLLKLIKTSGYDLIQQNGQRTYGPPPGWSGPPPPRGSEVFMGKLPRDCFEDELVPAFEAVGPIYMMRLMMDFSGTNRGYGFVTYFDSDTAKKAVAYMDGFEIRPGNKIGVFKSVDNCRLFIGSIPKHRTKEEIRYELEKYVDGITDVIMYPSIQDPTKNRGFVFVEFENHRLAAMARRKMSPGAGILWDQPIVVDWADPEPDVDPGIMAKVTKIYVRNLGLETTKEDLEEILRTFIPASCIQRVHKIDDYAFIHLRGREIAEYAFRKLEELYIIDGHHIEVKWARPRMYSKANRSVMSELTLCKSIPQRRRKSSVETNSGSSCCSPPYTPAQPLQSSPCQSPMMSPIGTLPSPHSAPAYIHVDPACFPAMHSLSNAPYPGYIFNYHAM